MAGGSDEDAQQGVAAPQMQPGASAANGSARSAQAFATTSGPIPAGSPMETAIGASTGRSAIFDDGVAPKIAELVVSAKVYAALLHLRPNLLHARHGC